MEVPNLILSAWQKKKKNQNQNQTHKQENIVTKKKPSLIALNELLLYLYFGTGIKMSSFTSVSATRVDRTQGQRANLLQLSDRTEIT